MKASDEEYFSALERSDRDPYDEYPIATRKRASQQANFRSHNMTDSDDDIASAFRSISGGKQISIPGTAREYTAIEAAAEALREAEVACKAATEVKADRGDRLIYALQNEGKRSYRYVDSEGRRHTIRLSDKTSVKITRGWEEEDDDGGS